MPVPQRAIQDDDERLPDIVRRLASGERLLCEEAQAIGLRSNNPLRRALRAFMGEEGYQRLPLGQNARRRKMQERGGRR